MNECKEQKSHKFFDKYHNKKGRITNAAVDLTKDQATVCTQLQTRMMAASTEEGPDSTVIDMFVKRFQ